MLFFSTLLGKKIIDDEDKVIGKIKDVIVEIPTSNENDDFPEVMGLLMKSLKKEIYFVPANAIERWGRQIILFDGINKLKQDLPDATKYAYLKKSVLDKQIVDLEGVRVVRVNDLQFSKIKQAMYLVGIDISSFALLRRLGLNFIEIKPELVEWKNVHIVENRLKLDIGVKNLTKMHPADIANIIEKLNLRRGSLLLQSLDKDIAARVLEEIQPEVKTLLIKTLGSERAATLMSKMPIDELVDLIQLLPSHEANKIINKLPAEAKVKKIKKILEYDEDTAGGLMTTEFVKASAEESVDELIEKIKKLSPQFNSIQFVYVLDDDGKFMGVISLRNLIVADKIRKIKKIMKHGNLMPTAGVNDNLTDLAETMTKYNLFSIAVLDEEKRMLGIITVDDIMRRLLPSA
ncbi:MAG: MgtE integral membrane protein [Candidatus Peregrinibacteria bacterium GW2011_GWF2_33_10]|nr:MAG: MgtE integral membrane protein [Candidatus Peregrinibacteria bacterium GW2011_GWF2_33_10]OGJ44985.1 MAG: hypothetical protein A2263_02890 [Candidatus Peregrinibacteria bacterium RIFOXYA2_FULL_33_21]OGJ47459.1 MAG: hypothetical protein A2272_04305 [Candidatus Peregrinibacteria bacterium RIFOXYA12_FULL_33_12]OGJ50728.1 MAG: hypothetical protein A2307_03705 [Candidatus Peregrinibacteria bacterium RIFOXYB2_FULL_33_20]